MLQKAYLCRCKENLWRTMKYQAVPAALRTFKIMRHSFPHFQCVSLQSGLSSLKRGYDIGNRLSEKGRGRNLWISKFLWFRPSGKNSSFRVWIRKKIGRKPKNSILKKKLSNLIGWWKIQKQIVLWKFGSVLKFLANTMASSYKSLTKPTDWMKIE